MRPCLEYCIQFWCLQHKKECGTVGASPKEATKLVRGLEQFPCGNRLRKVGLFSQEKTKLCRNLIATIQYLKGLYWSSFPGTVVIGYGVMGTD